MIESKKQTTVILIIINVIVLSMILQSSIIQSRLSTISNQFSERFKTEDIETSIDPIIPYHQTSSPIEIKATGSSDLDNVTLYYRYSPDNITWETIGGTVVAIEHNVTKRSSDNPNWELLYPNDLIIYNNGTASLAVIANLKDNGLSIWNVSESGHPQFVGAITGGHLIKAHDVKVWDNGTADIAVVVTYTGFIVNVDITNPRSPREIGYLYDRNHLNKAFSLVIEKEENFCYAYTAAAASSCMAIYNVTKTIPVYMGSCFSGVYSLFVEKYASDYVYVSGRDSEKLTVINVQDKSHPTEVGACSLDEQGWGHCKYGNFIYQVTGNDDSLLILNVSSSIVPIVESRISGAGSPNYLSQPVGVRIYTIGQFTYALVTVAGNDDGLTVINVTNPSAPRYHTGLYGAGAPYYMYDPHAIEILDENVFLLMYHNSSAPFSFATLWLNTTGPVTIWSSKLNTSNPDANYPWRWDFDFPCGNGYYEFYSIGKKAGFNDEEAPLIRDAFCCYINQSSPPYTPHDPLPVDSAVAVDVDTSLNWIGGDPDIGDTVTYDVYFGITNPPAHLVNNHTSTSIKPALLNVNTTYFWKVVSWDSFGASSEGPIWSFTTGAENVFIPSILLGIITNIYSSNEFIEFDAVDTWKVTFSPIHLSKYSSNQKVTIACGYFGIVGNHFIFTFCKSYP